MFRRPKRSEIEVVAPKEEEEEVNTWNPSEVMLWVDVICQQSCPS
jgi:hypothetical protein